MAGIVKGAAGLVGNTPLLEPVNLEKKEGLKARILLKLEYFNPAGSVKDRVGKAMIEDAEARGVLKPGSVIIEPTSGNTGIGLASVAASKGSCHNKLLSMHCMIPDPSPFDPGPICLSVYWVLIYGYYKTYKPTCQ